MLPFTNGNDIFIKSIDKYDFAINLDKDGYLSQAIEKIIPIYNNYSSLRLSDDKMLTILALKNSNINAPLTVSAPLCYVDNPDKEIVRRFLDQVEERLSYPLVFKECHGSLGRQVKLINNREELEKVYYSHIQIPHIYEEFLKKHKGHDYRIMVIDNKVVAAMERINENDFRSNIALGGKGYDVTKTIPEEYKKLAIDACIALGLDYAGIDVGISDDDKPCFIEANSNAFFTEIEKVTGINITGLLVEYLLKKYKTKNY